MTTYSTQLYPFTCTGILLISSCRFVSYFWVKILFNFMIGLVNCVFNLPGSQVKFFREFKLQKNCNQSHSKIKLGLVKMAFRLVHARQAVKLTFFAPWTKYNLKSESLFHCFVRVQHWKTFQVTKINTGRLKGEKKQLLPPQH